MNTGILGQKQVSELLGIAERTANELMRDGALPAHQIASKWFTTTDALNSYITQHALARNNPKPKAIAKSTQPTQPKSGRKRGRVAKLPQLGDQITAA